MLKKKCLYIAFVFCTLKIFAQAEVFGKVSKEGKPVHRANVLLLDKDEHIVQYGFTQKNGSFFLAKVPNGTYRIKITYQGCYPKISPITVRQKESKSLGTIRLSLIPPKEIKEVVIRRKAIDIKEDTISFRAKYFSDGTEQNVEELLKKIPGVKVDNNGRITVNKKEVSNVLIEGDDIFENGYQTLTQNMPSYALDKVQVLKNYTSNKLLKNIQKTESVALNLTINKKAKSKWFGSVLLASTSYKEDMRQGKFNLMNFSKRRKTYLLFNANNLGLNEMSGVKYLIKPSSNKEVDNVGTDFQTSKFLHLHSKNAYFEDKRTNFNNDKLVSLNHIQNFKKNWKLKFVSIYNTIENSNYTDSRTINTLANTTFTNIESKTWQQKNKNIVGKLEVLKEFENKSNFLFYNKLSWMRENNTNRFLFNDQLNIQQGGNDLFSAESKMVYTKKVNDSTAWVTVLRGIHQNRPYSFTENTNVFAKLLQNPSVKSVGQKIDTQLNFGGIKWSYIKRYNKMKNLEIQSGAEFQEDVLKSNIHLFDEVNYQLVWEDDEFQNDFSFTKKRLFTRFKFQNKISKHWKYKLDVSGAFLNTNYKGNHQNNFLLSPLVNLNYTNRETGNITVTAQRNVVPLQSAQILPNYVYRGGRSLSKNEMDFQILPRYSFGLMYTLGNIMTSMLTVNSRWMKDDDYIGNHQIIQPTYSESRSILIKDKNLWFNYVEYRRYFDFIKSRISLLGSYQYSDYRNKVNDSPLTETKNSTYSLGFEMKSGWTKKVNYELGYKWIFNEVKSEFNQRKYTDEKGYVSFYYNPSKRLKLSSDFEYYTWGSGTQKPSAFLDIEIDYKWKKQKANVFIKANNLLNTNQIQRYSLNNVVESIYIQKLLPLHIVFGISKNF